MLQSYGHYNVAFFVKCNKFSIFTQNCEFEGHIVTTQIICRRISCGSPHSTCSPNPGFLCSCSKTVEHYSKRNQKHSLSFDTFKSKLKVTFLFRRAYASQSCACSTPEIRFQYLTARVSSNLNIITLLEKSSFVKKILYNIVPYNISPKSQSNVSLSHNPFNKEPKIIIY